MDRPFAYTKIPASVKQWLDAWIDLLSTFTDYNNLRIPSTWFTERLRTLTGIKSAKEDLKRIDQLVSKLRILTSQVIAESRRDVTKVSDTLKLEYELWLEENAARLRKYWLA